MENMFTPEVKEMMLGILIISGVFGLINYFVTSLAIYSISKREKLKRAWLSWIPVGNFYQLIKLGGGKEIFIISMVGVLIFGKSPSLPLMIIGIISSIIYTFYSMKMYYNLCERYNVNFMLIAIGLLSPICVLVKSLGGLLIPILLIGLYGQYKLVCEAKKVEVKKGRKIETKVVSSRKKK